jgi:hypothetical protein
MSATLEKKTAENDVQHIDALKSLEEEKDTSGMTEKQSVINTEILPAVTADDAMEHAPPLSKVKLPSLRR